MFSRKFNLQPWRAKRREMQKKHFIGTTVAIAVICCGLLYGYHYLQNQYISSQEQAIQKLNNDIAGFKSADTEIKKIEKLHEEIKRQIDTISSLQAQRALTVEILDYLANQTPENVFLTGVEYRHLKANSKENYDSTLIIDGVAENENGISSFIRKLQIFPYFSSVMVINIEKAKSSKRFDVTEDTEVKTFQLEIHVKYKKEDGSKEQLS